MRRGKKVGVSIGVLLTVVSGISCWLLSRVWLEVQVTIQEPRFPLLVFETVGLGLTALFGTICAIYFWRKG